MAQHQVEYQLAQHLGILTFNLKHEVFMEGVIDEIIYLVIEDMVVVVKKYMFLLKIEEQ